MYKKILAGLSESNERVIDNLSNYKQQSSIIHSNSKEKVIYDYVYGYWDLFEDILNFIARKEG